MSEVTELAPEAPPHTRTEMLVFALIVALDYMQTLEGVDYKIVHGLQRVLEENRD